MLVLGGCSSDSSDDPASTIVRTTTSIAGAGVMGIERRRKPTRERAPG